MIPAPAWTDLPFPEGLEICGYADGLLVKFNGRIFSRHKTLTGAARGLTKARELLAVLGDLPANEGAA